MAAQTLRIVQVGVQSSSLITSFNPLSPSIRIQILQTDLHTFQELVERI